MMTELIVDAPHPVKLSLVVCTRNRANQLKKCLESLLELPCSEPWELVIVDNGSTDNTQAIIEQFRTMLSCKITVVEEMTAGLGRARNKGWETAQGAIISFTDDDCYPDNNYLNAVLQAFEEEPSYGFIGGKILLFDPTDYRITILEHDRKEELLPKSFIPAGIIQGANMSFRRKALEVVNGFDASFGAGTPFPCEDIDIVARLSAAGWYGGYDPRPVVFHHHGRKTEAEALRLMKQYDRGRGAYYAKSILNPAIRLTIIRNWFWQIRHQSCTKTYREVAAAIQYYLFAAQKRLGSCCK